MKGQQFLPLPSVSRKETGCKPATDPALATGLAGQILPPMIVFSRPAIAGFCRE
jgi:hypothetical protein